MFGVVAVTGTFSCSSRRPRCSAWTGPRVPAHRGANPLGYLTSHYWSPSALWVIQVVVVLTGLGFVVAASTSAIRVLFAMGRERAIPVAFARCPAADPGVAVGCVAALALLLGLPLTYLTGGAMAFSYLAGAGGLAVVLSTWR